jgi:hypothetical protein
MVSLAVVPEQKLFDVFGVITRLNCDEHLRVN